MRKALSVSALILALTCPVLAGIMPNGATQPPPPPAAPEEIQADGSGETEVADSTAEAVLNLLETVLSLL